MCTEKTFWKQCTTNRKSMLSLIAPRRNVLVHLQAIRFKTEMTGWNSVSQMKWSVTIDNAYGLKSIKLFRKKKIPSNLDICVALCFVFLKGKHDSSRNTPFPQRSVWFIKLTVQFYIFSKAKNWSWKFGHWFNKVPKNELSLKIALIKDKAPGATAWF